MNTRANDEAGDPYRGLHDLVARHLDGGLSADEQRLLAERLGGSPAARRALARFLRLEGATIRLATAGLLGGSPAAEAIPPADGSGEPAPEASAGEQLGAEPRGARRTRPAPPVAAPARRPRPATPALAWGLVAVVACVAVVAVVPRAGFLPRADVAHTAIPPNAVARGEIGAVADRWIEVRRAREPVDVAMNGPPFGDDTVGDKGEGAANPPTDQSTDSPIDELADTATDPPTEGRPPPAWLVAALADELAEPTNPDAS
jgi:hypothetical protein